MTQKTQKIKDLPSSFDKILSGSHKYDLVGKCAPHRCLVGPLRSGNFLPSHLPVLFIGAKIGKMQNEQNTIADKKIFCTSILAIFAV